MRRLNVYGHGYQMLQKYKFNDDHAANVLGFLLSLQQQWFLSPAAKAKRVMLVIGS